MPWNEKTMTKMMEGLEQNHSCWFFHSMAQLYLVTQECKHSGVYLPTVTIVGPATELGKLEDRVMILME